MRSVKPGRVSYLRGIISGIMMIAMGIFWLYFLHSFFTSLGLQTTVQPFSSLTLLFNGMGWLFIISGGISTLLSLIQFRSKNRMSIVDITDSHEEADPLDTWVKGDANVDSENLVKEQFCTQCGQPLKEDDVFCGACGKKVS